MKRIIVTCDGTWNRADARQPTNVVRLARAVPPVGEDGVGQILVHVDGVGSGRGTGRVARAMDRALGGVFGMGLMAALEEAYRFLVFNYAPGDQIYVFGYSRGAFTARSLVGLIRNCGILERDCLGLLPEAMALYRARDADSHPEAPAAREFRARHAAGGGRPQGLAYVGVWDTVGSLGIPAHLWLAARANRGLGFHDTALSGLARAARHAVAIDERRRTFTPALWGNLAELNARAGAERYRQLWFPGVHGCVGGGAGRDLLANDPLLWVAEGAMEAGLSLDPRAVASWWRERDCRAPFADAPGLLKRILAMGRKDRAGPGGLDELARAALWRWRLDPGYRPRTLSGVADAIEAEAARAEARRSAVATGRRSGQAARVA
jgi:uncharacterized protein (DUF2235 family)